MKHLFNAPTNVDNDPVTFDSLRNRVMEFRDNYGLKTTENKLLEQEDLNNLVVELEKRTRLQSWLAASVLGVPALLQASGVLNFAIILFMALIIIFPLLLYHLKKHKVTKNLLRLSEKVSEQSPQSV